MDVEKLITEYQPMVVDFGVSLVVAVLILFVGRILAKGVAGGLGKALDSRDVDPIAVSFVKALTKTLIFALAIVISLTQVGVETASLIAVLGAAGLAVGLALQGSLSNFASGILLVIFKPCRAGDFVEAGGVAGVVERIDLLATTIVTPDNKQIIVPNSVIMGGPITNYSIKDKRRVDMVFGVSYDADLKKTKEILQSILDSNEKVLKDPAPVIALHQLADSSVNFVCRPWVKTPDYWTVYFETHEHVKARFDAEGIGIPYPQMDVYMKELPANK